MSDVYREHVLDHYKNPRNYGEIKNPDFSHKENNFLCGDSVQISGILDGDIIKEVKFNGKGCVISQASASLLTEYVIGKTKEDVKQMDVKEVVELLGVDLSPTRMKCGELGLLSLKKALNVLE